MLQAALAGLLSGGAYALLAVCLVLLYRMTGTLNFALGAMGVFGTFVMFSLYEGGRPLGLAVGLGLLASVAVGGLLGWAMARWFAEAPLQVRSSVTIAYLIALLTLGFWIFGTNPKPVPHLVGFGGVELLGLRIPFATLVTLGLAALLALGVALFLQRTRAGVWLRALADRPTAAELLGVPVQALTVGVWAFAGGVSALAVMLIAPNRSPEFGVLSLLVLPAMAGALVGLFRSFPLALVGGLGIGLIEGVASSLPIAPYRQALWFLVMLAALLWSQRKEVWDAAR
ncbi:MAG: branched-chain amino acid ABC transporter permease [Meiothermus sp.]|uniref:ABC transporter permease subunit n=1 Tax=Meiothermus sp. TaxID=1955249 RepID=UPI002630EDED|nr:branched-chain amino acid ABC transporter permease [Meiothermus sp.]MCS7059416.1 branched-chain amino acid ABC transporter permease [Meiothermus sp.]MCX7739603.1 branched-chain amino acid ABC transporter permease [Meiothermus sp.]